MNLVVSGTWKENCRVNTRALRYNDRVHKHCVYEKRETTLELTYKKVYYDHLGPY